jgi:hypothetical protein
MKRTNSYRSWLAASLGWSVIAAAMCALSVALVGGADTQSTNAPAAKEAKPAKETKPKAEKKKFTGAELYAMHCNRCHPERYATERTPAQWKTIMLHMRVRANLPANQAKTILKYLQEDAGTP